VDEINKIVKFLYKRPLYSYIGGKRIITGTRVPSDLETVGIIKAYLLALLSFLFFITPFQIFGITKWEKIIMFMFLMIFSLNLVINVFLYKGRLLTIDKLFEFIKQTFMCILVYFIIVGILCIVFGLFFFLPKEFRFVKYSITFSFFLIYFHVFIDEKGFNYLKRSQDYKQLLKYLYRSLISALLIILI